MKAAVVFLTKVPSTQTILFAEMIAQATDIHPFIVIDDEKAHNNPLYSNSRLYSTIEIADKTCKKSGYRGANIDGKSTHIKKDIIAWDKMLYYFCELNTDFDFIWVFEDDVFIPSHMNIVNLHKKYSGFDLVVPRHAEKTDNIPDWHWPHIFNAINPPYYYSMVCAVGLSRKMVEGVRNHVNRHRSLFHVEAMFNTLAVHNRLLVCPAKELRSVVWKGDWNIDHFILLPDNVFHPKKDVDDFHYYRNEIRWLTMSGYRPTKTKLPDFLTKD